MGSVADCEGFSVFLGPCVSWNSWEGMGLWREWSAIWPSMKTHCCLGEVSQSPAKQCFPSLLRKVNWHPVVGTKAQRHSTEPLSRPFILGHPEIPWRFLQPSASQTWVPRSSFFPRPGRTLDVLPASALKGQSPSSTPHSTPGWIHATPPKYFCSFPCSLRLANFSAGS